MRGRLPLFALVAACPVLAVLVERLLEARDEAHLAKGETFLDRRGSRIRYRASGHDRAPPTVVLLNGFVAPLEQWDDVRTAVAAFAPVLAYDRGGLGLSRGSNAYDATSQAHELLDVLHATQAKLPVVLVGYSSSALLARVFIARHPELVRGVVFIDGDTPEQILDPAYRGRSNPGGPPPIPMDPWAYMSGRTLVANALGLTRIKARDETTHGNDSERARRLARLYLLTSHWRAAYGEGRARKRSGQAALAWPGEKTDLPLGVVSSGADSPDPYQRALFELNQRLAGRSTRGAFVSVSGDHNRMVEDAAQIPVVVDMIRTVVDKVRQMPQLPQGEAR
jgi:pimeloyl-ACP methyl ester carboxylesterase